jgi:ABC-type nitrate/sulfonate/bicarbonate transport system substrate-binding protein
MKTKGPALIALVIIAVIAIITSSFFYINFQSPTKLENLTFGDIGSDPLAALVHVAQDQNLFRQNGINLTITNTVTGPNTINATQNGVIDLGTSLEYAFVANSALKGGNLSIIATIDKSDVVFLIARKDSGIQNIADLKQKKIGLSLQQSGRFYLGRFLELNGISLQAVTLVDLPASEWVTAFVNGTVDAIVAGKSYIAQAQEKLPNNTVVWSAQNDQLTYSLVFARNDWINQHSELVQKFLISLTQAENYVVNHQAEAKAIIQKQYNATATYINQIWPDHLFSVTLDQSLIAAMEGEARWLIQTQNNSSNATSTPNFINYIKADELQAVKPESVNIIR